MIVALVVGVGITLVAGLFPAIRATRVPPIAAVREGATLPKSRFAPFVPWVAGIAVVVALVVLARAMFTDELGTADRLLSIAAGVLLLFLGVAMLSSHVVGPLAAVSSPIGRWAAFGFTVVFWPFWLLPYWLLRYGAWGPGTAARRVGAFVGGTLLNPLLVPIVLVMWLRRAVTSWEPEWPMEFPSVVPDRVAARTGGENARRNPSRTAATAAALMIGIALVSFIATLTNGMKVSNREAIEEQIAADYVVTSLDGYTPFVAAAGDALAASAVPELVTSVRSDAGLVDGDSAEIGGIEPDTIAQAYVFDWREGDESVLGTLGTTGAVVSSNYTEDHDIAIGDVVTIRSTADRTAKVMVVGTFEPPPFYPLLESVNLSTELFDSLYDRPRNSFSWANVEGDPTEETQAQLAEAIGGFPDTQVETREEWIEREDADLNQFISFLYVMLTLAVFVSVFGMINTLVLSVYERTREIGMLRAIGMTRRQTRRMVRQESIITALIGAAVGLPLGIFLAALVNRALSEYSIRFSIPWGQLAVLTIVAIVIGILAAIMPARRAAKLDPLRAIAYE
ncbi:MAG: ABC transporter permease [Actinobacteria bacterium]|nr:ABC transporter permease [Actinomycetota bacterium]